MADELGNDGGIDRGFILAKSRAVISSTLVNLQHVHEHPYALRHDERPLEGRTVIVVGAGPSLEKNGHHLREAQEKGIAIMCVNASGCGTNGKDGILRSLGVRPDVMVVRESLILDDQMRATDARMVVLDISVHPLTWQALTGVKDEEWEPPAVRWYVPLYPRHGWVYRKLGVRPLGTGSAALTGCVAHAIAWGAAKVVLCGADLAMGPDAKPYHEQAPRGDERAYNVGKDGLRFEGRDQDSARCERSLQPSGPDELRVTHTIAHDWSRPLRTLHTWENQRTWLQIQGERHHEDVDLVNATEGGGGILWWRNARLSEVIEAEPEQEPMKLPEGVTFDESITKQVTADLRREAVLMERQAEMIARVEGPSLKDMVNLHGWIKSPLLVSGMAAKPLLDAGMLDEPIGTPARLIEHYEIHIKAAKDAKELIGG